MAPGVFVKNSFILLVLVEIHSKDLSLLSKLSLSYIPSTGRTTRGYIAIDGNESVGCVPHSEKHLYLACEINVQ